MFLSLSTEPYDTHTKQAGAHDHHANQGAQPPGSKELSSNGAEGSDPSRPSPCHHPAGESSHPWFREPRRTREDERASPWPVRTRVSPFPVLSLPASLSWCHTSSHSGGRGGTMGPSLPPRRRGTRRFLPLASNTQTEFTLFRNSDYRSPVLIYLVFQDPSQKPQKIPNFFPSLISYSSVFKNLHFKSLR